MISSTARDLPEHREQVRLACIRAGFEPWEMMEHLTAEDADPVDVSLRMVQEADVYLGILAYRYGTIPDSRSTSITEMEYDQAVESKKPRLMFFIHKDHPITIDQVDTGPPAEKLKALKDRIGEKRVAAFFKSPEDLRSHVVEALTKLRDKLDATQDKGTTETAAAALHRITSIPAPPAPYIAHPYTLLQSRELVGRQAELNALTDWAANPASASFSARVFCFVAIGGMGKSALAWKWFNQIAPNEIKPLAGRMWWSFYESDATFDNFLNRALCYVSGQSEDAVRALPWQEREAQLLQQLNEKPYLFVLDGLERILIAYHRMDASYLADDDYDQQTANVVAGAIGLPPTAAQSFVGQHRLRRTTDPRAGMFLQKLAHLTKSRILVTTRLYPSELQLPTGQPRPGCLAIFLRGLSDDDALGLWRTLGVTGARAELVPIFRSVEGHPLLVQALASEVANYRQAPSDFTQWRMNHPQFDPTSLPLVQSRSHILEFALKGLSRRIRTVLSMVVGFRMPTSYATLEALLVGAKKGCPSVRELDRALTELEDRGLIGWDRAANRYDAHPIVRGVVRQLTNANDQRAVYSALEAHFKPMATPEWDRVETLADLTPAIERYNCLVELGRYDDALQLFRERLAQAALYRLAAHRERIAWLERLFPPGKAGLPALASENDQGYLLNALAQSYQLAGWPGLAVPLFQRSQEIDQRLGDDQNLEVVLINYSEPLGEIGALRQAEALLRRSLVLNRKSEVRLREVACLRTLGRVVCLSGNHGLGLLLLERSQRAAAKEGHTQSEGYTTAVLAERSIWLADFVKARSLADKAWDLAEYRRVERDFMRAALLQGRASLGTADFLHADERLHLCLTRARAVNAVEFEIPALISISELDLQRDRLTQARARLDDTWEAIERGPYPLQEADASNVLAAIARAENNKAGAIQAAARAYRAAWCDGPPHAYHWGLEKAKAHLAALGAPEPKMPPFDASKFESLPEVDINPRDEYWVDPDKLD
jgi:hypothetical protein